MNNRTLHQAEEALFNILKHKKLSQSDMVREMKAGIARVQSMQNEPSPPSLEAKDRDSYTLLDVAVKNGYLGPAQELIQAKVNLNTVSVAGNTPLMCAAFYGSEDVGIALVNAGAELDNQTHLAKGKQSALMYATTEGNYTKLMRSLLSAGANPNLECRYGNTALDYAIRHHWLSKLEQISLLLEYNAKKNTTSDGCLEEFLSKQNQQDPQVKFCWGVLCEQKADYKQAQSYFKEAVAYEPAQRRLEKLAHLNQVNTASSSVDLTRPSSFYGLCAPAADSTSTPLFFGSTASSSSPKNKVSHDQVPGHDTRQQRLGSM